MQNSRDQSRQGRGCARAPWRREPDHRDQRAGSFTQRSSRCLTRRGPLWLRRLALPLCLSWASAGPLTGQASDSVRPLFDGRSLAGWVVEDTDAGNFSVRDGVLRVEGPRGWLRSAERYEDFALRAEFRLLSHDSDSGVFVRADGVTTFGRGWAGNSYQVQIRDVTTNQTDSPILIGDIYRHRTPPGERSFDRAAALTAARQTGEWQELEVEVIGDSLLVRLNGMLVTRASNIANPTGYIGLQGEAGIVEFRSIRISERRR
jgi:hypothetical protein